MDLCCCFCPAPTNGRFFFFFFTYHWCQGVYCEDAVSALHKDMCKNELSACCPMTRCRSQHLHPVWGLDYKYVQKLPSSSHDTLLLPSLNVLDDLWLEQSKCWGTTKILVKILYLMVYVSVCRACIPTWDPLSKHMASEQSGSGRPLPWRSAGMTSLPDFCSSPPSYSPDSPSSCWLIEPIWATVRKTLWGGEGGGRGWGLIFWVWITWGFTSDELWELLEHQQRDFLMCLHQVFMFLFQPLVKVVFLHLIKYFFLPPALTA